MRQEKVWCARQWHTEQFSFLMSNFAHALVIKYKGVSPSVFHCVCAAFAVNILAIRIQGNLVSATAALPCRGEKMDNSLTASFWKTHSRNSLSYSAGNNSSMARVLQAHYHPHRKHQCVPPWEPLPCSILRVRGLRQWQWLHFPYLPNISLRISSYFESDH